MTDIIARAKAAMRDRTPATDALLGELIAAVEALTAERDILLNNNRQLRSVLKEQIDG